MKQFRTLAVAALAVTAMTAVSPAVALADTTVVQPQPVAVTTVVQPQPVAVTTVAAGATTTIVDTNPGNRYGWMCRYLGLNCH